MPGTMTIRCPNTGTGTYVTYKEAVKSYVGLHGAVIAARQDFRLPGRHILLR